MHRTIFNHRDMLPPKAVKYKYPTILWITPPCHQHFTDNIKRQQLSVPIENAVMMFNEMHFMKLRSWNYNDPLLITGAPSGYRYTDRHLAHYWSAIDTAIEFWDSTKSAHIEKGNLPNLHRSQHPKWTHKQAKTLKNWRC